MLDASSSDDIGNDDFTVADNKGVLSNEKDFVVTNGEGYSELDRWAVRASELEKTASVAA